MTSHVHMRNVLVLLGIILTAGGVVYFGVEFRDELSDLGRVLALVLLAVIFVALGAHYASRPDASEIVDQSGWRWLKVHNALYIVGAVSAFAALISFFALPDLDEIWKVAIAIALGLALILFAARRQGVKDGK